MAEELSGLICVKCPKPAEYTGVDPKKAWYCRECFIQMVRNKFRSSISKKRIFNDENARDCLIVLEGTPASTFLLNQIDDALRQVNFKRLMIRPKVRVLGEYLHIH
ncbi:unnamed protein product [Caenorhabditis angaria]|uniref:Cytoplasmic tRNA 2-thiolation protein 2 n=1 Tax=Caenorhabditis angaria TaxID=860376 RepID=A0A9P1I7L3_9PELO|nr:unnamed protein product [Caenorhabditis angaria]